MNASAHFPQGAWEAPLEERRSSPEAQSQVAEILDQVRAGVRIQPSEALELYIHADLQDLALAATWVRNRHNDPEKVSYVVDRNINYTNICNIHCSFCAFHKKPENGYVIRFDELRKKVMETLAVGGTGILLQGGVNPDLPWEYYLELLRFLAGELGVWVHGFSPVEIRNMATLNGLGLKQTLVKLRQAGLGSLPGGGAEILCDRVRRKISPRKGDASQWLEVMEAAHEIGLVTTGTMMFGILETLEERIEHLQALRDQQDRAISRGNGGGYSAFAAWPFQSFHTAWEGKVSQPTDAEYLRTTAIARIYLDNFKHIQASWVTMGPRTGQMALHFGCDDMGSLMLEENVVRATGTRFSVNRQEMDRMIHQAGFQAWQRSNIYEPVGTSQ